MPLLSEGAYPRYTEEDAAQYLSKARKEELEQSSDLLWPPNAKHYPFLDITRIMCVWCVAIDHGNSSFGKWNVMFTQIWVLQFLFLVCGVCYGMSNRSLCGYLNRLLVYFTIGSCINLMAWMVSGMNWQNNVFGMVFQFWFVAGLMIYAIMLAPLKGWLKGCDQTPSAGEPAPESQTSPALPPETQHPAQNADSASFIDNRDNLLKPIAAIGGTILVVFLGIHILLEPIFTPVVAPLVLQLFKPLGTASSFWGAPSTLPEANAFVAAWCDYILVTVCNCALIFVGTRVMSRRSQVPWLLIFNTYVFRAAWPRGVDERPFHGLELTMLALTCYHLGLEGRRKIGKYIIRYWFVVIWVCSLLWPPYIDYRLDEHPPQGFPLRFRYTLIEMIFVVCFLTAGERLVQKEIFTEDRLQFLNTWALIVFLVHKAVHILIPPPFNWIFLVALMPTCWACQNLKEFT